MLAVLRRLTDKLSEINRGQDVMRPCTAHLLAAGGQKWGGGRAGGKGREKGGSCAPYIEGLTQHAYQCPHLPLLHNVPQS